LHHIARIDPSDFFYRAFLTCYIYSSSSFFAAFGEKLLQRNLTLKIYSTRAL